MTRRPSLRTATQEFNLVDCCKLICAFLVLAIHTRPFCEWEMLAEFRSLLTRLAVPYFFFASSYFLFVKLETSPQKEKFTILKKYLIRLSILFIFWNMVYFPFTINYLQSNEELSLRRILFTIEDIVIRGGGYYLWFFHALIFGTLLVCGLQKKLPGILIAILGGGSWLVGLALSTYFPLFSQFPLWKTFQNYVQSTIGIQNWLFFAFPYILLGYFIFKIKAKYSPKYYLGGIVLSFWALCIEAFIVMKYLHPTSTFLWISAFPITWFLARFTLSVNLPASSYYKVIRTLSVWIYVSQYLMIFLVKKISNWGNFPLESGTLMFLATALLSLVVGIILLKLARYQKLNWIKKVI